MSNFHDTTDDSGMMHLPIRDHHPTTIRTPATPKGPHPKLHPRG